MSFEFPLSTVLRVRGITEEREERLLQKILLEIAQTVEALAAAEAEIEGSNASRRGEIFKPIEGYNVHASYGEVKNLKQSKALLEQKLEKLKLLRDRQMKVYQSARRNREVLTDMHNAQRDAYNSELTRREQIRSDENYGARRGRC